MSAVQKFLEYSLYNLSNFVAPANSDVIDIQGLPTLAWTNPLPTISYGTTPYTTTQPTATYSGSTVAGSFSYNPTLTTVLPVGTNEQVCVTFTPTNSTNYLSVTTPFCTSITVTSDTTTTTFTASSPVYYGQQPISLSTPQVTTGGPATLNEGTLTVTLTGSVIGSVAVCTINLASSSNTCPANLPATYDAGTYTLQACYTDTAGNFANSCSAATQIVINPDTTTTTVSVTPTPAPVSTTVTLTATVADANSYPVTPVGSVTFYDGTNVLGTVALTGTSATFTTASLIVGVHSISACYVPSVDPSGTYDFQTSCSAAAPLQVVVPPPALGTATVINSSDNPSIVGTQVTFSAAVATTGSFPSVPAGTMNFLDGTTLLNPTPIALDVNGYGTFTTSTLTVGTHPITAVFLGGTAGSNTYAGSTSTVLNQVVTTSLTSAGNGFLMLVNPTAISVGVGNSATANVSIAALNNFNQTVQLSCTGMPAESTCSFAQGLIPVGGGMTTLTVNVAAPHACGTGAPYFVAASGVGTTLPLVALSALGLFFMRKRKRLFQGMTLALALCLLPVLNGCATNCTDFGTQPGTYTFTVTATAGGAIAPSTTPQVSTQTVQMIVHL